MPVGRTGLLYPWEVEGVVGEDLTEIAYEWNWVNKCPFTTRLAQEPADAQEFRCEGSNDRPDYVVVTVARADIDTVFTLADVTYTMRGDTWEFTLGDGTTEQIEVISDPDEDLSQVTVKRGDAFTTPTAIPAGTQLRLIGNSRTGGEEDQEGIAPLTWGRRNWVQVFQHPVEIAGILMDTRAFKANIVARGATNPLDAYTQRALNNCLMDQERTAVYQRGMAPTDGNTLRAKTKGFRQQCEDAGSYIWQPLHYAAYSPEDLLRDLTEGGPALGDHDVIMCSPDWRAAFARWKAPMIRIDMGATDLDVRIKAFRSDVHSNAVFVINPRLKRGTIMAFVEEDVKLRPMRQPTYFPRGRRGDAVKGDVIARTGVQVDNPEAQRFIEGVTGFAAFAA